MKFIHISDVHMGMKPDLSKHWSSERARAIRETFRNLIDEVYTRQVDFLFISGDLFHHQPTEEDLIELSTSLSKIPTTQVIIISGRQDAIRESSALHSFQWPEHVHYILSSELQSSLFADFNLEVWTQSINATNSTLTELSLERSNCSRILLLYHDAAPDTLNIDCYFKAKFSYLALGGQHKKLISSTNNWGYPGTLEPLEKKENGKHGFIYGELNTTTGEITTLDFVPISKSEYISLNIQVTSKTTNEELCSKITEVVKTRGSHHIYSFHIRGNKNPMYQFDLMKLQSHLRILECFDEAEPEYDFVQLYTDHSDDMIGFYIRQLQKEDMTYIEKKALYYGINALLKTERGER